MSNKGAPNVYKMLSTECMKGWMLKVNRGMRELTEIWSNLANLVWSTENHAA